MDIGRQPSFLEQRLEETEREIEETVENSPLWQEEEELLFSIPGVGPATARVLMTELLELGEANRQEIAKLVGARWLNRDSGKRRDERSTWGWGGRASVRKALYMATLAATRCNQRIQEFYDRVDNRGKAKKKALVACMRKLLVIRLALMKNDTEWNPERHASSA